jgi:hypothetical protein
MIIARASQLESQDIEEFSWFSLRAYHNTKFTAERIIVNHQLKKVHFRNAEKQAEQIRFFLLQAREYFEASKAVTLVTRPVLLYYSAMCLATAEFLFKQSGDSSLDRARESHRHHGLSFLNGISLKDRGNTTIQSAAALIARPATRNVGERFGTFELWHRSAREYPTAGKVSERQGLSGSHIETFGVLAFARDERFSLVPESGVTLLTAIKNIPGMISFLAQFGEGSNLVRAYVNADFDPAAKRSTTSITIHPGNNANIAAFFDRVEFDANDIGGVEFTELPSGGIIKITNTESGLVRFRLPACTSDKFPNVYFCTSPIQDHLNEFGLIYIALYIVGNYARYYPDYWIYDLEKNTQLGMFIEHLLDVAERRIGLLTLSELARVFYVPS